MLGLLRVSALAVLTSALACHNTPPSPGDLGPRRDAFVPDSAATVARTAYSGFVQPVQRVIGDLGAWSAAWQQLNRGLQPQPALPAVDFRTQRVVLVGIGTRSNGGFAASIDSVVNYENGSTVYFTATEPGSGCMVTMAITQPVHAVRVASPKQPVVFQQASSVRHCK